MINTDFIKGVIPPILTPIDANEKIDEAKLRKHVNFIIDGGCHGILAFGSNGEFYMIDEEELERGLKIIVDAAAGRIPIYMGIGAIRTKKCIELAHMGIANGVSAISVLQPMFLKPTYEELYLHMKTIAQSIPGMPMLLYNHPRVGYSLTADFVCNLAAEMDNVVGMKDSSGNMTLVIEILRRMRGKDFRMLCGASALLFATLAHGGVGGVCTLGNIYPHLVSQVYEKFVEGDLSGSLDLQYIMNPLHLSMDLASFPAGSKSLANIAGLDMGLPYLPSLPASGETLNKIQAVVDEQEAIALKIENQH